MHKNFCFLAIAIFLSISFLSCTGRSSYTHINHAETNALRNSHQPFLTKEDKHTSMEFRAGGTWGPGTSGVFSTSSFRQQGTWGEEVFYPGTDNGKITLESQGTNMAILLGESSLRFQMQWDLRSNSPDLLSGVLIGGRLDNTVEGMHFGTSMSIGLNHSPWTIQYAELNIDTLWFDPLDSTISTDTLEENNLSPVWLFSAGASLPLKQIEPYFLIGIQLNSPYTSWIPSEVLSYSIFTGELGVKKSVKDQPLFFIAGISWHSVFGSKLSSSWSARFDGCYSF